MPAKRKTKAAVQEAPAAQEETAVGSTADDAANDLDAATAELLAELLRESGPAIAEELRAFGEDRILAWCLSTFVPFEVLLGLMCGAALHPEARYDGGAYHPLKLSGDLDNQHQFAFELGVQGVKVTHENGPEIEARLFRTWREPVSRHFRRAMGYALMDAMKRREIDSIRVDLDDGDRILINLRQAVAWALREGYPIPEFLRFMKSSAEPNGKRAPSKTEANGLGVNLCPDNGLCDDAGSKPLANGEANGKQTAAGIEGWYSVTDAAELAKTILDPLRSDDDDDRSMESYRADISGACSKGKIECIGKRTERLINPQSFNDYLEKRKASLLSGANGNE